MVVSGGGKGPGDEGPGAGTDAGAGGLGGAIALDLAKTEPNVAARTAAYLDAHTHYLRLQSEHLHEQHLLELAHLRHRRWVDRLGMALQALTIVVGIGVAGLVIKTAWDASQDHDLVVEPFAAAPDLAARGLNGTVLATHLIDKLTGLQEQTSSARAPSSYRDGWRGEIKVEIPETGISFDEARRFLIQVLGHETRISGDVVRGKDGRIAVTARVGDSVPRTFQGPEADLDRLIGEAATQVYCDTQSYRCALYVQRQPGRFLEGAAKMEHLAKTGSPIDRLWAQNGVGVARRNLGDLAGAIDQARKTLAIDPGFQPAHWNLAVNLQWGGRPEAALSELRLAAKPGPQPAARPELVGDIVRTAAGDLASLAAEFSSAVTYYRVAIDKVPEHNGRDRQLRSLRASTHLHDVAAAKAALAAIDTGPVQGRGWNDFEDVLIASQRLELMVEAGDKAAVVEAIAKLKAALVATPEARAMISPVVPNLALGQLFVGDMAGAEATLSAAPEDCYECDIARGHLAIAKGDAHSADVWFAKASSLGPSLAFADEAWGRAELSRGHLAAASGRFMQATKRAPHWADPLKGLGDIAARQGRWTDALERYDAALKCAPNWAALHQARAAAAAHGGAK